MKMSQVAFDAAATILDNRKRFKNFYRTLPQYEFLPRALVRIAQEFDWTQMAVITQTENLFTSVKSFVLTFCLDYVFVDH